MHFIPALFLWRGKKPSDSEAGRIFESETTANQSEIRRAYLVYVIGNFVPIT